MKLTNILTTAIITAFVLVGGVSFAQAATNTINVSLEAESPESVTFTNNGSEEVDLSDYSFGDENNNEAYSLSGVSLAVDASYKFCESDGGDCDSGALSGSGTWNNDGDTIYIVKSGSVVFEQAYDDAASSSPVELAFDVQTTPSITINGESSESITTIQAAIDTADEEDTIEVAGTYEEAITIPEDKDGLTLKAKNENGAKIDVSGETTGISIKASDVTIEGFEIIGDDGTMNGIIVTPGANNVTIKDNKIHGMQKLDKSSFGSRGILVYGNSEAVNKNSSWRATCNPGVATPPSGTKIIDNVIYGVQTMGISLGDCTDDTKISGNTIRDLELHIGSQVSVGIQGSTANGVNITNNTFTQSEEPVVGINLDELSSGDISGNIFNQTPLRVSHIAGDSISVDAGEYAKANFEDVLNDDVEKTGYYSSIQDAIDEATASSTVEVAPGTYEESVTINKPGITLESTDDRDQTTISADATEGVMITKSDVTVRGFTVTTNKNDTGTHGQYGIRLEPSDAVSNILIEDNIVKDISDAYRSAGISLDMKETDDKTATDVTVRNNIVRNITGTATGSNGDIVAKAINPNERFDNLVIEGNTIQNIGGPNTVGAIGIDFSSDTGVTSHAGPENFTIEGNDIAGITIGSEVSTVWKDDLALYFHDYGNLGDHSVTENKFRDGDVLYNTENVSNPDTLNTTHNWWGSASGPSIVEDKINYEPYYVGASMSTLSDDESVSVATSSVDGSGKAATTTTKNNSSVSVDFGSNDDNAGSVTVVESNGPTGEADSETGESNTIYLEISADTEVDEDVTISVQVATNRLNNPQEATLHHYNDGEWKELDTDASVNGAMTTLTATSEGLSPFAIVDGESASSGGGGVASSRSGGGGGSDSNDDDSEEGQDEDESNSEEEDDGEVLGVRESITDDVDANTSQVLLSSLTTQLSGIASSYAEMDADEQAAARSQISQALELVQQTLILLLDERFSGVGK